MSTPTAEALDPRLLSFLVDVANVADPRERARLARDLLEGRPLDAPLRDILRRSIGDLRAKGLPWSAIGEHLGVSGQRAQQLSR